MNYHRQRSVAALRPGDRIMAGHPGEDVLLLGKRVAWPDLTEFTVTAASPGLVESRAADGTPLDIRFERTHWGELRFADYRIERQVRWTIPLPVGPAEAVKAYAEVLSVGEREAALLHVGEIRDDVTEVRLVERLEAVTLSTGDGVPSDGDWTGAFHGNAAFWDCTFLVATDTLPQGTATGDLVGAARFKGRVADGVAVLALKQPRRIGAFPDVEAIGAFMPAPFNSLDDHAGRPLDGSILCGPAGHYEILLELERAVARTEPDEALALWVDGRCTVLASTGIVFHNVDDVSDQFPRDELGDGLFVFQDAKWWSYTSYEGEHDAGIDGSWRAATPADVARFGFADEAALDAEIEGQYDLTEDGTVPVEGLALRMMERAEAALERDAVPAPVA